MRRILQARFIPLDGKVLELLSEGSGEPSPSPEAYFYGGGGFLGLGSAPSPPPAPNYTAAAQAQGQANQQTAMADAAYAHPNQVTPQGSQSWKFTGTDINNPKPGDWQVTSTLSPDQQKIYNQNNQISTGLNQTSLDSLGRVSAALASPYDTQQTNSFMSAAKPVQDYSGQVPTSSADFSAAAKQAQDAQYAKDTQFMDERFGRQNAALDTQLRNQGLQPGTDAYNNAMTEAQRNQNSFYQGAQNDAILAGNTQAQTQYQDLIQALAQKQNMAQSANASNLTSGQNAAALQEYLRTQPLNETNALRTGNPVSMPAFASYQQGNAAPAPIYNATNDLYNAQLGASNAATASNSNFMSGLMSMGGQLGAAYLMK